MPKRVVWVAIAVVLALAAAPASLAGGKSHHFELRVLSSPPDMVTGGDALVRVTIPRNVPLHKAKVFLNGSDVTSTLELDAAARTLSGMVTGLNLGANTLSARSNGAATTSPGSSRSSRAGCDYSKPDVGRPGGS